MSLALQPLFKMQCRHSLSAPLLKPLANNTLHSIYQRAAKHLPTMPPINAPPGPAQIPPSAAPPAAKLICVKIPETSIMKNQLNHQKQLFICQIEPFP